ncbi:tyrosine recombinase XerC [Agrilactobacillus fermenti]|uniref:tyrosine recombinase XerC n=1 Tax=Agrilactobacillus fermenti TaxID=2586909 RepID=UPI001E5776AC|nr:tyrosine recombinase XerC [Agrilactobacillus fermenti]MCD2256558.1 tyrosine recombinase XerC [Agrilactobacillus fermenti]
MFELSWLEKFVGFLQFERHYSDKTIAAYQLDIKQFMQIVTINDHAKSFKKIDGLDVTSYLETLDQKQLSPNSIARKVSSLRTFYHFLNENDYTQLTPFTGIITKKKQKRLPEFFYPKEMMVLLQSTQGETFADKRDRALIELLYATGMRASECVQLTLPQLDWQNQIVLIHGKGNKDRYVPFGRYAKAALLTYRTVRDSKVANLETTHDFVFINQRGQPLTTRGLEYILDQRIKHTSLTSGIHPHMIRHTFATQMLENGADMRTVQELLGHASLATTQIYTHVTMTHLQKDYRKYFPRATD